MVVCVDSISYKVCEMDGAERMARDQKISASLVLKSGIWYTVSNFAFRAVAFITTPIFSRLLSQAEYGEYNNITSWISILFIFTSCDLYTSIIRAKLDYEDDIDRYGFSVLTLGSLVTVGLFALTVIFRGALADLMGIQPKWFLIIYVYLFFVQGYYVYITIERAHYRYKTFSILTGVAIVSSCFFSLLLVLLMQDRVKARVYGQYLPYVVIGLVLYILVARKGKKVHTPYYRYGLKLSLPLIPHLLSLTILSSSDKIMITKMVGAEYTALYSVAYIVANIVTILIDSMNKAWAPWFLDSVKANDLKTVKKVTRVYFGIFLVLIIGMLLVAPELILVLGGEKYKEGIYVLPYLLCGCIFQFAYTMYVQVEFYEKKMQIVSIATSIAALTNIGLNFALIPYWGYIAAGYTTLIGYILLFFIHYFEVCRLGYRDIFNRRIIFVGLCMAVAVIPLMQKIFQYNTFRYMLIVVYALAILLGLHRYRNIIKQFMISRKR